ncbi:hypothetical protein KQX54_008862 [Cotesia glomerata]|uniref:Calponin-homology (CH) domain-containing protein n=1 Tax=Cotesia glomerata TaxID=32391 RepID=A0AAV7J4S0_COTGL|nr:hypothetical protein KQX54_008862 [Cotesia glomerata]
MACIRAPRSVSCLYEDKATRNIVQIYTDWANHYLERGGCKRRVSDLQADLCDGVLLADLVESVTNQKVIDINRKPKSAQQMNKCHRWSCCPLMCTVEKWSCIESTKPTRKSKLQRPIRYENEIVAGNLRDQMPNCTRYTLHNGPIKTLPPGRPFPRSP